MSGKNKTSYTARENTKGRGFTKNTFFKMGLKDLQFTGELTGKKFQKTNFLQFNLPLFLRY